MTRRVPALLSRKGSKRWAHQVSLHTVRFSALAVLFRLTPAVWSPAGLLNTAYYCCAFGFAYSAAGVSALGLAGAGRRAVEVLSVVWAASQVTKPLRVAGSVALAPFARRVLESVQSRLQISEAAAFGCLVGACLFAAVLLFAALLLAST